MALFNNYIQAGRLAIGRFGSLVDTPCVVVDIVTLTRVIVVVPKGGRVLVPIKRLIMTPFKLDIPRGATEEEVAEALKSNDVVAQYNESREGRESRRAQAKKNLTDFERFRVVRALEAVSQQ